MPGASNTTARQLNNAGQVIGSYQNTAGISHSFVYQDGRYHDVAVPGAAFTTVVQSSGGKLLGTFFDSSGTHPFIGDNSKDTVLSVPGSTSTYLTSTFGSLTSGPSINDSDQLIGGYSDSTGSHSFPFPDMGVDHRSQR